MVLCKNENALQPSVELQKKLEKLKNEFREDEKKRKEKIDNFSLSLSTHSEFEFEIVLMGLGRLQRWVMGLVVKLRKTS